MATIEEIAKECVAAINSDAAYLLAVKWADSRYKQLVSRARFRHLRETGTIDISAGGSTFDAPSDLRWFGTVVYDEDGSTLTRVVQRVTIEELDDWYPTRTTVSGGPRVWAEKGLNAGGTAKQIEVYPEAPVAGGALLRLVYWEEPTALAIDSSLPFGIDDHVIREGILVDLMRWEAAKATRNGETQVAMMWAERTKEQEVRWELSCLEAIRADRGDADDLLVLEQKMRTGIPQGSPASSAKYPSR
jgi:hypothetical protein